MKSDNDAQGVTRGIPRWLGSGGVPVLAAGETMARPVSHVSRPFPAEGPPAAPAARPQRQESGPLRVINGAVYFSGECEECRTFCAAVCCKGYSFVSLTEEEAQSGRYMYKEASPDCDCSVCQKMRELGIKYTLRKRQDESCVYLDGNNRCSIYENRPETCKQYSCAKVAFNIRP